MEFSTKVNQVIELSVAFSCILFDWFEDHCLKLPIFGKLFFRMFVMSHHVNTSVFWVSVKEGTRCFSLRST